MQYYQLLKQELEIQRRSEHKRLIYLLNKRQRFSRPEFNEEPWSMAQEIVRHYEQKAQELLIDYYQTEQLITKLNQFEAKML